MQKLVAYIKDVQAGGSTSALKYISSIYTKKLCVFVDDTSDVQIDQVYRRAVEVYNISEDCIYKKAQEIKKIKGILTSGLIIVNKHKSSLESLWSVLPKDSKDTIMFWDEADYDAPGHKNAISNSVQKHHHLDKLLKHVSECHFMTATQAGLVVSDLPFTDIYTISNGKEYLPYKEIKHKSLGDEDVAEMLKTGRMSPTLEDFLQSNWKDGIMIRSCRKVEDMESIKKALGILIPEADVQVLNGTTKEIVNPKTFKGILISFQMAARGVSFPNLKHIIVDFAKSTSQPVIVQSMRTLGYGKRLKNGNFVLGNSESLKKLDAAFEIEAQFKDIMRDHHSNPEKRKELVRSLGITPELTILPPSKGNGFKHKKIKTSFVQEVDLPYCEKLEEALIEKGELLHRVIPGKGIVPEWGSRSYEKGLSNCYNQPPQSPVRLERGKVQQISPDFAIERLVSKEEVAAKTIQWGHVFNTEGIPIKLVRFKLFDKSYTTNNFTDET